MPTVQIVEARHIAPYDGAFWERAYFKLSYIDGNPLLEPIYDTPLRDYSAKKTMPTPMWMTWGEVARVKQKTGVRWATWEDMTADWHYRDVVIHTLTDVVTQADRDKWNGDPYNLYPTFWRFFMSQGIYFEWTCDCKHHYGDNPTSEEPVNMSGYQGNGGVGIEVSGWFCGDCPHPDDLCWRCDEIMEDGVCVNPECKESPDYVDPDAANDTEEEDDNVLRCPECGEPIWDLPSGHKLAKCRNSDGHASGDTLAFDTMSDEEDDDEEDDRDTCLDCEEEINGCLCGDRDYENASDMEGVTVFMREDTEAGVIVASQEHPRAYLVNFGNGREGWHTPTEFYVPDYDSEYAIDG